MSASQRLCRNVGNLPFTAHDTEGRVLRYCTMASSGRSQPDNHQETSGSPLEIRYAEPSPEVTSWQHSRWGFGAAAGELVSAGPTGGGPPDGGFRKITDQEALARLRAVRLNIAPASETVLLPRSDAKYRYVKSELGLNMIVPSGKVTELRFHVDLCPSGRWPGGPEPPVVLDGFPHSDVSEKALLAGQIRIAVNEAFKFLPLPPGASLPLGLTLKPWDFRLGTGRRITIQFSGGLTSEPEWYATEKALIGDFRIAMIIRAPVERETLDATVQAYLRYDPGFWHRADAYTDKARVPILTP